MQNVRRLLRSSAALRSLTRLAPVLPTLRLRKTMPLSPAAIALMFSSAFLLAAVPLQAQQVQPSPAILVEDSASLGALQGELDARNESTTGWWWRGFAGGATLGPIGGGFAYALATNSGVALPPHRAMILAAEHSPSYAQSYEAAFADELRDRRKRATIGGGALGTAALAAVATTIWAVYYFY